MKWRVVYGETRPMWERSFPTRSKAMAFAKKQRTLGDVIFGVAKIIPGEPPRSITAAIEATMDKYSKPTKPHPAPCSAGWFALPKRKRNPCKKCGAEFGQTCKAERGNIVIERRAAK